MNTNEKLPSPDVLSRMVLASSSPQRRQILEELNIDFRVLPVDAEEVVLEKPDDTVLENAKRKALLALPQVREGDVVLAADTIVHRNGRILGKPENSEMAKKYLAMLSGHSAEAWSGIVLIRKGDREGIRVAEKAVFTFSPLSSKEIDWYVATKEPLTRAGAFGISHFGEIFISRLDGSYSCTAGLPKRAFLAALSRLPAAAKQILPVPPPTVISEDGLRVERVLFPDGDSRASSLLAD